MTYADLVKLIIDNLEGGYYHPDMYTANPSMFARAAAEYQRSGETMYGFDRKNGAPGVTTATSDGVKFWNLVDKYYKPHHGDTKYWNDKADGKKSDIPASVGAQLKQYATGVMKYLFEKNLKFFDEDVKKIVLNDPSLLLQFFYATYNGSGNFQNWANILNNAYKSGNKDPNKYWDLVQAARRAKSSSVFKQGADILDRLRTQVAGHTVTSGGGNGLLIGGLIAGGALLMFLLFGNKKKSKKRR